MNVYFFKAFSKTISLIIFFVSLILLKGESLNAEYVFEEIQIDSSTKTGDDSSVIPNNPFEIVEMIRRINSLNDATDPSDALDDALESFNSFEDKK